MNKGDIILTPFPFTDSSRSKVRPALLMSDHNYKYNTVIIVFISSITTHTEDFDIHISKENFAFKNTGLKKNSVFRCRKIATIDKKILIGKIGEASPQLLSQVEQKIAQALSLTHQI